MSASSSDVIFEKDLQCVTSDKTVCVNMGGATVSTGQFFPDKDLVTYLNLGGLPKRRFSPGLIQAPSVEEQVAYMSQMYNIGSMAWSIQVFKDESYDLQFGVVLFQSCTSTFYFKVNDVKSSDTTTTTCRKLYTVKMQNVPAKTFGAWGKIVVALVSSQEATVSTMCVTRKVAGANLNCKQPLCDTLYGNIGYAQIYGSTLSPFQEPCRDIVSTKRLILPNGVKVVKAILRWATYKAIWKGSTTITLDNKQIKSDEIFVDDGHGIAYTDVTTIVSEKGAGSYSVADIISTSNCVLKSWSIAVVYEKSDLPKRFINMCRFRDFYQDKQIQHTMNCVFPKLASSTTIIMHSARVEEVRTDDELLINGKSIGKNVITGKDGRGFDVWKWTVASSLLKYSPYTFTITNTQIAILHVLDLIEEFWSRCMKEKLWNFIHGETQAKPGTVRVLQARMWSETWNMLRGVRADILLRGEHCGWKVGDVESEEFDRFETTHCHFSGIICDTTGCSERGVNNHAILLHVLGSDA